MITRANMYTPTAIPPVQRSQFDFELPPLPQTPQEPPPELQCLQELQVVQALQLDEPMHRPAIA